MSSGFMSVCWNYFLLGHTIDALTEVLGLPVCAYKDETANHTLVMKITDLFAPLLPVLIGRVSVFEHSCELKKESMKDVSQACEVADVHRLARIGLGTYWADRHD